MQCTTYSKFQQTKKLLPYIEDGGTHWSFMSRLSGFIHLLAAGANGLLTLEGQNTNCADVFYVWVCIAYQLEQVLANPSIGVSAYRSSVIEIYNHRFNQMMMESSHYVFLLAYFLHPCKCPVNRSFMYNLSLLSIPSLRRPTANATDPH